MSFTEERLRLIERLRHEGIRDEEVLRAMSQVPREEFVLPEFQDQAYENSALPIHADQTISQPYIVALMTEALQLKGSEKILEIGTGSGYQAAVLSLQVDKVITLECIPDLAFEVRSRLEKLGYKNVECHLADGTLGWEKEAPYDGILVTAAAPQLPASLTRQLKEGGRLVIPTGPAKLQKLYCYQREGERLLKQEICNCRFVKLIGKEGWLPDHSD